MNIFIFLVDYNKFVVKVDIEITSNFKVKWYIYSVNGGHIS